MRRQLDEIKRRRAVLVARAEFDRIELSGNSIWVSIPFLIAGRMLDSGRPRGYSSSIINYSWVIFFVFWPETTLRMLSRGLKIWSAADIFKKYFLRRQE